MTARPRSVALFHVAGSLPNLPLEQVLYRSLYDPIVFHMFQRRVDQAAVLLVERLVINEAVLLVPQVFQPVAPQ